MTEQLLNELYERFGYRKYKMTRFEPYDLYAENRDFLKSEQLITFTDLDGTLLALRPDITLSIMKSNNGEDEKVYYNETVYRPKDRHYREILQAGIEYIGLIDLYAEAEVIALAAQSLGLISDEYVIRVSDAAFLRQMFDSMELSEGTVARVLQLFAAKNISGIDELAAAGRMTSASAATLKSLAGLYMPFGKGVKELERYAISNSGAKIVSHLGALADVLAGFGVTDRIYLDFSLVNSMDYYNGVIFQGAVRDIPFTVLWGGRYDRLPEKMGRRVGAIGFSLDLDTVEDYRRTSREYDVDILLVYTGEDPADVAARVKELTEAGNTVRCIDRDRLAGMQHGIRARRTILADGTEVSL